MPTVFDIYIEPLPADEQSTRRGVMTYGFKRTIGVAGLQRLANRFLLNLLTLEGSDPSNPRRGTPFSGLIGANVNDEATIRDVVQISIDKTVAFLLRAQQLVPNYTDRDRLRSAELTSIVYDTARAAVGVEIRIENVAGRQQTLQIPLVQD